jgi:hypothetical protein
MADQRSDLDLRPKFNFLRIGSPGLLHCWDGELDSSIGMVVAWASSLRPPIDLPGSGRVVTRSYISSYSFYRNEQAGGKRRRGGGTREAEIPLKEALWQGTRRVPSRPGGENCHFSRQIRHFPACIRVPAPFNLHLRNARTEVRCTVSRSLFCTLNVWRIQQNGEGHQTTV